MKNKFSSRDCLTNSLSDNTLSTPFYILHIKHIRWVVNVLLTNKNSKLTNEEYEVIKSHPVKGSDFVSKIGFLSPIVPFIRHHHERIDGKGYPDSLSGVEIPLVSKIIAVADTFDAITTDRPYRRGASVTDAIKEMQNVKDTQLDGKIVDIFIQILQESSYAIKRPA